MRCLAQRVTGAARQGCRAVRGGRTRPRGQGRLARDGKPVTPPSAHKFGYVKRGSWRKKSPTRRAGLVGQSSAGCGWKEEQVSRGILAGVCRLSPYRVRLLAGNNARPGWPTGFPCRKQSPPLTIPPLPSLALCLAVVDAVPFPPARRGVHAAMLGGLREGGAYLIFGSGMERSHKPPSPSRHPLYKADSFSSALGLSRKKRRAKSSTCARHKMLWHWALVLYKMLWTFHRGKY
jgi:hypothetical protein